ncbi:hypothetical protein CBS147355_9696 [Penicillium roqueforti]|nr:hypothetical protein CBS147355_9696 [Penicillium roqueforti]KAI3244483.1 hypothetical protein CBS147309_9596 [Penicillium roqueforti]
MTSTTENLKSQFPDLEWYKLPAPQEHPQYTYDGFQPGVTILKKGHTCSPDRRAFETETIFERDVSITMRDGIKIYTDVFRPAGLKPGVQVPAILPWRT